ncbi:MAG: histidinol-phosphate transaminase [Dehalococcoidia bacterium]|nr:histidinol-phosphate transaminase [Dehalococcoidia bacterium]
MRWRPTNPSARSKSWPPRSGVPVDQLVKLDADENSLWPGRRRVRRRHRRRQPPHLPRPRPGIALRAAIGRYLDVDPASVVAGAGADDIIDILLRLCMPPAAVTTPPTFGMYGFLARINRTPIVEAPRHPGFGLDVDAVARAVADGANMVFVTSPNNPTGTVTSDEELRALCALDALVVVDEAYAEFAEDSCVPYVASHSNLVVLRTFSKWAGLAGLRVGYGIANPALVERMMAIKQPYNVNVAADVAARAAIEHREEILPTLRALCQERDRMVEELGRFEWLEPVPSQANFVLFRVQGRSAAELAASLRRQGVLVRHYDRPDLRDYIRISAGRPSDTTRLVEAMAAQGAPA